MGVTCRFFFKPSLIALSALLFLQACAFSGDNASGYRKFSREECVPYARRVSGIQIYGNAHTWWSQAAGNYARGNTPVPGAVLVLAKTSRLKYGHLAVIKTIYDPRTVEVTHTNWGDDWFSRRITYESLRVQDVSKGNDWTSVRFWNRETGGFGAAYAAYGFIYNQRPGAGVKPAIAPQYQPLLQQPLQQPAPPVVQQQPVPQVYYPAQPQQPYQMAPVIEQSPTAQPVPVLRRPTPLSSQRGVY